MPNPLEHSHQRGAIEELVRRVPGFHGYLERAYRRESDALLRQHLAERLEHAKRSLDGATRALADSAQLDLLPQFDRVRGKLDKMIGRLRGAMRGYSGVFDLVRIDEGVLDTIYAHDLALSEKIEDVVKRLEAGSRSAPPTAASISEMLGQLDEIDQACDKRDEILKGLV
ncbi:MAG TPA: hypothetical protein VGN42_16510 [Pirellulales bacterium]|jgi:hypothetical protein|nr:hypothetical protein [Pirellulales bacterium]